jgi:adenine C2-methylase RlmN of 23S rRNA A2503 and tRNA A37
MEVIRTIKPGMPGSRRFQKHWGKNLVAVRYRRSGNKLFTTIEIVVDERDQSHPSISLNSVHAFKRMQLVAIPIAFEEGALRAAAKRNQARWSAQRKVWVMPYSTAVTLGVQSRVVEGLAEKCLDVEMLTDY